MDIKNLAKALMEAEAEMDRLVASSKADTGKYSYKYADLAQVYATVREPLRKHGVVILQGVTNDTATGAVTVDCTLMHCDSGEFKTDALALIPSQNTPQAIGSAISYARRYLLVTMLNLAPEDDDGAAASQGRSQAQRQPEPPAVSAKSGNGKPTGNDVSEAAIAQRKRAVKWAMTEQTGTYRLQEHAENTYDKLARAHLDASLDTLRDMFKAITEAHKLLALIDAKAKFPEDAYKRDLPGLSALVADLKRQVHSVDDDPFNDADIEAEMAVDEARAAA